MSTEVKADEVKETKGIVEVVKDAPKYKGISDFLVDVKKNHDVEIPLSNFGTKTATGIGDRGGPAAGENLVTPSFVSDVIYKQMMEEAVIMPKCTQFKLAESAGPTALIKQVNETTRTSTSTFGGLRVYKVDEGSNITASTPVFTQKSVTLEKAAVLTYISDEAIRDVVGIVDQTAGMVAQSFGRQIDNDIVNGGLSIATAIVGDGATVAVTVAGSYPTAAEYFTMFNSMHPGYRNSQAEWYMGTDVYASLQGLATPITTSGAGYPLVNRNMKDPDRMELLGHKINVVEWATAAATAGSVMFINLSGYALVTKEAMQAAMSIHVAFISAQNCYRWYFRYNGAPLYKSKITLTNSMTVSYAVTRN
jgi:HK97 family phage major capsid protein